MMRCGSCDIDLTGCQPIFVDGKPFCCSGCAAGGPCVCLYDNEQARRLRRTRGERVGVRELLDRYERLTSG